MSNARRTIQGRFITPPSNNSVISAQQQPTQYAPWRSPSITLPAASWRKPPWRIKNANGIRHWFKPNVLEPSPLIAARRDEQERCEDAARASHRGVEQSGAIKGPPTLTVLRHGSRPRPLRLSVQTEAPCPFWGAARG